MVILENIDIDIDIDKAILQIIDIDKISNRFKFGISNRASQESTQTKFFIDELPVYQKDLMAILNDRSTQVGETLKALRLG